MLVVMLDSPTTGNFVLVAFDKVDKSDIPIESYSSLAEAEARVASLKDSHWYLKVNIYAVHFNPGRNECDDKRNRAPARRSKENT